MPWTVPNTGSPPSRRDGAHQVFVCDADGIFRSSYRFRFHPGRTAAGLCGGHPGPAAISPDGRRLFSADGPLPNSRSATFLKVVQRRYSVRLWDARPLPDGSGAVQARDVLP